MDVPAVSFAAMSDHELLNEVQRLVACERMATAALLRSLMELDVRRLYLREGCSSLFTYCTQVLHLGEAAAYNRIEATRAARRFPPLLDAIEEGSLTLTAVRLPASPILKASVMTAQPWTADDVPSSRLESSKGSSRPLTPLSREHYRLQLTLTRETHDKLRHQPSRRVQSTEIARPIGP